MNATILDPLALWGIQGMTHQQTLSLIAAAPELLLLLEEAAGMIRENIVPITPGSISAGLLIDIDAAIAKAKGRAS